MSFRYVTKEPVFWPSCDDVDFAEKECPNCEHQLFSASCSDCAGEGGHDGYEDDPLWYDPGDLIPCGLCDGLGFFLWCPRCRWDATLPERFNRPERRLMALVPLSLSKSHISDNER